MENIEEEGSLAQRVQRSTPKKVAFNLFQPVK